MEPRHYVPNNRKHETFPAMIDNTRDLVIANTADLKNLEKKVDAMSIQLSEIHDSMLHAKGAWFTLLALSSAFGFLAGQFSTIRAWLAGH